MPNYVTRHHLSVEENFCHFIEYDVFNTLTSLTADEFWQALSHSVNILTPKNTALLQKRQDLQKLCDDFYRHHKGEKLSAAIQENFLRDIGYIVPEGDDFSITTSNIDNEICHIAGPQLIVPVKNARYALNAANARWGSLFDALYGSDAIDDNDGKEKTKDYNPKRGDAVIDYALKMLDEVFPFDGIHHSDIDMYDIDNGHLYAKSNDKSFPLKDPSQFIGYNKHHTHDDMISDILLCHHHIHINIIIDRNDMIGKTNSAGIKDIIVESAITVIQDFEDSVACVDSEDKIDVYRNWLGLMTGDLQETFVKNNQEITRTLVHDKNFITADGQSLTLKGRALLLARNVGHLMTNNAVRDNNGNDIYEGILDGFVTVLCALHNINKQSTFTNSTCGSIYIVKPKMHGPEEVAFADELFTHIENAFGLNPNTIKIGVMDEEKRTTLNLKESIRRVKDRIVFINTGFLDRTGCEIRTGFEAGIFLPKDDMKNAQWLGSYEKNNVDIGLKTGFSGKAQIGKGMWAMPDDMAEMLSIKIGHLQAGANCAWVPSPTAATLHALHYLQCDVFAIHRDKQSKIQDNYIEKLLELPLCYGRNLSDDEITRELRNNAQSILGYVVRWIDQGVGCSKVPNIDNVALMEDRATLRISSQILANWLYHGVCHEQQIRQTFADIAQLVDQQNVHDPAYKPLCNDLEKSYAFQASLALVFDGKNQPDGYTEPLLHEYRLRYKNAS